MSEFRPATTLAEVERMDDIELDAGFMAGLCGAPEPVASCYSRAHWHGWRAGMIESGRMEPTEDDLRIIAEAEEDAWIH